MPTIKAWFPTFIYESPLLRSGAAAFNRTLLSECEKLRAHDDNGRRWSAKNYPGGYTSYDSWNRLHKSFSTFAELERRLRRHVHAYIRHLEMNIDPNKLEMTDCWVNVMPRHAVHGLHLHPVSTISGTYYVKTPRGSSRIRFEDPRLANFMAAPPKPAACRPENQQQITYDVSAGNVLLWESWLRHEVRPSTIDAERVSISFNYNWF
ncbi:MAG TPA: TIGR02466 family protein [Polyangia bacterium]